MCYIGRSIVLQSGLFCDLLDLGPLSFRFLGFHQRGWREPQLLARNVEEQQVTILDFETITIRQQRNSNMRPPWVLANISQFLTSNSIMRGY